MSSRSHASDHHHASGLQADRAPGANVRERAFGFVSLFTSFGTLICCALPSLLVLFGLGATVASFLSAAPWLVTMSRHKAWVFAGAGSLIAFNFVYVYALAPRLRGAEQMCPVDEPTACGSADRISRLVLWISAAMYAAGFVSAYVVGPILLRFQ